jgi:hypothetical protein
MRLIRHIDRFEPSGGPPRCAASPDPILIVHLATPMFAPQFAAKACKFLMLSFGQACR